MYRLTRLLAALVAAFVLLVPTALAADPELPHTGRVVFTTEGDVTIPAGDHADLVVVVNGTATIAGEVNTLVAIESTATLSGATTETVVAIRSPVTLAPGTVVRGDVMTLDSAVLRQGDAAVEGSTRDITGDLVGVGLVLAPVFLLLAIGFAIAAIGAGLLLAGLAARQVRAAEEIITREPVLAFGVGLLGAIVPFAIVAILFVTIVGAPLAFALLFGLWPVVALVGYLVTGIWIGDWLLTRLGNRPLAERPYLAAIVGLIVLQVLSIWPFLPMLAGLFGYGAVLVLAWRVFRGPAAPEGLVRPGAPAPMPT